MRSKGLARVRSSSMRLPRKRRSRSPASPGRLWTCEQCGRVFANRNQTHTCARLGSLEAHFARKPPRIREIFDAFLAGAESIGAVRILAEKSRIAFQARMSFAQLSPRRGWVDGHLVLARRREHPRFRKVESFSPRNHVHHFRLSSPAEVDDELLGFLREAYDVGEQRHMRRKPLGEIDAMLRAIRTVLRKYANPTRARGAQAYMKSSMPYYGLDAKTLRAACKQTIGTHPLPTPEAWREAALRLWREATHREERYAAIELTGARPYRKAPFQTLDALPMYEEFIVDGAWWDYVDTVAIHRVGEYLLRAHPREMKKSLLAWAKDDNVWRRRSAIISQVTFKEDTDLPLLERCIAPSLGRKEFWLRKAIGWALRQYAWTDPRWTARYVKQHEAELSELSKREALKNISRRR